MNHSGDNSTNCTVVLYRYTNSIILHKQVDYECFKRYTSVPGTILIALLLFVIGVGTTLGNTLVILAVALVKKLQTPSNLLIVSLAASDLLVGCIVVPFAIISQIHVIWPLDKITCDVFIVFDVLLCTSSILNLTAISVDRYLLISRPFQYAVKRTPFRMAIMVLGVWVTSALISVPPIIGWERNVKPGECGYPKDLGYQIYATIGAFYLPLIVMLVLYGRIFKLAHRMATADAKQKITTFAKTKDGEKLPDDAILLQRTRQIRFSDDTGADYAPGVDNLIELNLDLVTSNGEAKKYSDKNSLTSINNLQTRSSRVSTKIRHPPERHNKQKNNSETKAIKTLGVIMGGFTLCWLPFFIIQLVKPILEVIRNEKFDLVPRGVEEFFVWLGYINSFLNPIIYAKFNREFRTPFKEILLCHCASINNRVRSESYAEQYGLPVHTFKRQNHENTTRANRISQSSDVSAAVNRKSLQSNSSMNGGNTQLQLPDNI